jgi:glycosyltransferase involved in cell wall biosynthesis
VDYGMIEFIQNKKCFSIIIACYNSAKTITNAVSSLIPNKDYIQEVIIVDNLSTDNTTEISSMILTEAEIQSFIISERDYGVYDALNKGINVSKGKYIGILHSDDEYLPTTLELVFNELNKSDSIVIYGNALFKSLKNKIVNIYSRDVIQNRPYAFMPVIHSSVFLESRISKLIKYDVRYNIASDYKWIMKLLDQNLNFVYLNQNLIMLSYSGISNSNWLNSTLELVKINIEEFGYIKSLPQNCIALIYIFYKSLKNSLEGIITNLKG